jgi:hypothetical protein
MKNPTFIIMLFIFFNFLSCKKIENRINNVFPEKISKKISIKNFVKDFQDDNTVKEIEGIQIDDLFYKEYFLYTGNKKRVIEGINKIDPNEYFNENCRLTTKQDLDKSILKSERNNNTMFFWKFEKLKKYEIYTSTKGLNKHYIIFDANSDTIYHRAEEIAD